MTANCSTEPPDEAPLELQGTVFTPVPGSPRHWSYRPAAVTLARGSNGHAQLSLVEVGSFAMVSLTTQLAPDPAIVEQARDVLAERASVSRGEIILFAKSLEVGDVALLVGDGGSELQTLSTSTSSGATPYATVFSIVLDPGQLAAVKKALAGEPGWLVATYAVRLPPVPPSATETSTSRTVTTTTVTQSGSTTTTVHQDELSTPPVTRPEQRAEPIGSRSPDLAPQVAMITTDAATWASSL